MSSYIELIVYPFLKFDIERLMAWLRIRSLLKTNSSWNFYVAYGSKGKKILFFHGIKKRKEKWANKNGCVHKKNKQCSTQKKLKPYTTHSNRQVRLNEQ